MVDYKWLEESKDYNAAALRQAIKAQKNATKDASKSLPWRIMHRVTYVSRILPEIADSATMASAERAMKASTEERPLICGKYCDLQHSDFREDIKYWRFGDNSVLVEDKGKFIAGTVEQIHVPLFRSFHIH